MESYYLAFFLDLLALKHWLNSPFHFFQEQIQLFVTTTGDISSSAQCSMAVRASIRLGFLVDSCLAWSSGQLGRVLPMWGQAFLGQSL